MVLLPTAVALAASAPAPPVERPAIDGVIDAFEKADIVTLGERPWSKLDSDFRHALIADPRFAAKVNDIVVEFANARHQTMLDRYVVDLAGVPADSLRAIWQDASAPGAWDSPVYAYMLEVVRRANQYRPREQRLRVLAGEPPIDWSQVHSAADVRAYGPRGAHALDVIDREVLAKGRKALVVYSERNFFRRDRGMNSDGNLTTHLEERFPKARVFVIGTLPDQAPAMAKLDSALTTKDRPVLVSLATSKVGTWPAGLVYPFGSGMLSGMADALLYYGYQDDSRVRPSDRVMRDPVYTQEVARRKALLSR
jgi:hypothetical protein